MHPEIYLNLSNPIIWIRSIHSWARASHAQFIQRHLLQLPQKPPTFPLHYRGQNQDVPDRFRTILDLQFQTFLILSGRERTKRELPEVPDRNNTFCSGTPSSEFHAFFDCEILRAWDQSYFFSPNSHFTESKNNLLDLPLLIKKILIHSLNITKPPKSDFCPQPFSYCSFTSKSKT